MVPALTALRMTVARVLIEMGVVLRLTLAPSDAVLPKTQTWYRG
ncbi:MAG TPA: hypothetical protein VNJ10_12315 [Sphingomonas sp.]|nr:hypothetical protein [Sphingomonas sp.]